MEEHGVEEHGYEQHGHEHGEGILEGILEITFGLEHIVAEFFWNAVFVAATFFVTKGIALRKAHKYIDDKHGITHEKDQY